MDDDAHTTRCTHNAQINGHMHMHLKLMHVHKSMYKSNISYVFTVCMY